VLLFLLWPWLEHCSFLRARNNKPMLDLMETGQQHRAPKPEGRRGATGGGRSPCATIFFSRRGSCETTGPPRCSGHLKRWAANVWKRAVDISGRHTLKLIPEDCPNKCLFPHLSYRFQGFTSTVKMASYRFTESKLA
jgi:hypothetical protein